MRLTKILLNLGTAGVIILGGMSLSQWIKQEPTPNAIFVPIFAGILLVGIYLNYKERKRKN